MKFTFSHNNITVLDLEKSIQFYKDALGFDVVRSIEPKDNSFKIVYLSDGESAHKLELTWYAGRTQPYNLGENEIHLAVETDDYEAAYALHKQMSCICYENDGMGLYFIADPDGYWTEILRKK